MKKQQTMLSQERLRHIAWEVGHKYPIPPTVDYISLSMICPCLGYVCWHVMSKSADELKERLGGAFGNSQLIVRVYDVTNIIFDGTNAHIFFDLNAGGLSGNYYFGAERLTRNYLAEIGFRSPDGSFHPVVRSNTAYFDCDRPSGNYQVAGLFVGNSARKIFPVENIFDAPVYEEMSCKLAGIDRKEPLRMAVVFIGFKQETGFSGPLGSSIKNISQRLRKFGGDAQLFAPAEEDVKGIGEESLLETIQTLSKNVCESLCLAHEEKTFHVIHCHDWYSSAVGGYAAKKLNLPVVLSLHSTEHERTCGAEMNDLSLSICEWERRGVQKADLIIVPRSSTYQQVMSLYGAPHGKVVIVPDVFAEAGTGVPAVTDVKRWFGLNQDAPVVLFAGEISHASGADLLADALPTVCRNHRTAQFLFAGDGPLKNELQAGVWHTGLSHRCRFLGDVQRETFEILLMASDFVVIPARTWQDEGLAQMAVAAGKPVLTTHQSGIKCIVHGENGLITFDNPGSIVWGIQEMLFNPLKGSMLCIVAKRNACESPSLDSIAARHYLYYEMVLKGINGAKSV